MDLNVEFVSMLAQAQRAIGTNGVDRFIGNLGVVAQMKPEVLDKFDGDRWADHYSEMLGVDPRMIVAGDEVALLRNKRAEAETAQAQMQMAQQAGGIAKDLGQTPTGQDKNAMMDVMNQFSGYNSPSPLDVAAK